MKKRALMLWPNQMSSHKAMLATKVRAGKVWAGLVSAGMMTNVWTMKRSKAGSTMMLATECFDSDLNSPNSLNTHSQRPSIHKGRRNIIPQSRCLQSTLVIRNRYKITWWRNINKVKFMESTLYLPMAIQVVGDDALVNGVGNHKSEHGNEEYAEPTRCVNPRVSCKAHHNSLKISTQKQNTL